MSVPTSDAAVDVAIADEIEVAGYGTPDPHPPPSPSPPPPLDQHPTVTSTSRGYTEDRQESPSFTQQQQPEHDNRQQGSREPPGQQAEDGARDGMDGHGSGPENDEARGHGMLMSFYFVVSLSLIRYGIESDDTILASVETLGPGRLAFSLSLPTHKSTPFPPYQASERSCPKNDPYLRSWDRLLDDP